MDGKLLVLSQLLRQCHPQPDLVVEAWDEMALIALEEHPGHPLLVREMEVSDFTALAEGRQKTGELREVQAVVIYGARRHVDPEAPEQGWMFCLDEGESRELWLGQGESVAWLSEPLVFAAGGPALVTMTRTDGSMQDGEYLRILGEVVELYYPPGQAP